MFFDNISSQIGKHVKAKSQQWNNNRNYTGMFINATHTLLPDDKLEIFVIVEDFLERWRNDFTATSFTDLHFSAKLRIPSGIIPIRMYPIALM